MSKKSEDDIRRIQELRRSNAASPVKNKSKYSRRVKHPKIMNPDKIDPWLK